MRIPHTSRRFGVLAAAAALTSVGAACSGPGFPSAVSTAGANPKGKAAGVQVGPGPQGHYRVQHQPPADSCQYRHEHDQPLPDRTCTPGATSPDVTQANIDKTICRKGGYTSKVRPPTGITGVEKRANAKSYGYTDSMRDAEYDHLISLELGGDPNDAKNLWVEPPSPGHKSGSGPSNPKDAVEARLHTAVCKHEATLSAAQRAIAADWTTAESVLGLSRH